jgi:hypothetical protein
MRCLVRNRTSALQSADELLGSEEGGVWFKYINKKKLRLKYSLRIISGVD